jgi:hypothetical protein
MPIHADGEPKATRVDVALTWVPKADVMWDLLVEAFHRFYVSQMDAAIIPANTAVEVAIGRLLTARIETVVSERTTEEFLTSAATYGYQLNVLLPLLARLKGFAPVPQQIQVDLRHLKKLRNVLAHEGQPDRPLTKEEVARCLTAAVLAIHYTELIRSNLMEG